MFPSDNALTVYYRDITDRKLSEQRLMAQYAVSRTLNAAYPLEETGASLLAAIGTHLGWRLGQLWIPDKAGRELSCAYSWQADMADYKTFTHVSRAMKFARGEGFPGTVGRPASRSGFPTSPKPISYRERSWPATSHCIPVSRSL